jgi:hypothetical protein
MSIKVNSKFIAIFLVSILLLIIGILYYQKSAKSPSTLPIIEADHTPFKMKPTDPGGMVISHLDKTIYDNFMEDTKELSKTEKVLPKPEEPLRFKNSSTSNEHIESIPYSPPQIITSFIEKKSQTQSHKALLSDEIKYAKERYISQKQAQIGMKIQLGTYRSEAEAEASWHIVKKRFPKQLDKLVPVITIKDIEGKGKFYQLQAGFFSNKNNARALCKHLSSKGQNCFLAQE